MHTANGVLQNRASFASLYSKETDLARSFVEFRAAEPPTTLQVFPSPGTYRHPAWGSFRVTREGNQQFVDNFNNRIYQETVAIDAEHASKLSGAVGHITRLDLNADGSVEASVTWTERGQKLIRDDRFRYFSPEWFVKWEDPATGSQHENVLIGGALTNRPFFKELRSLVASEDGQLYDFDGEGDEGERVYSPEELRAELLELASGEVSAPEIVSLEEDHIIVSSGGDLVRFDYEESDEGFALTGRREPVWQSKEFSPDKRRELASKGLAMPDGSYPIETETDLRNAIQAYGRANRKEAVKRHIIKRARALGQTKLLPEDWTTRSKKEERMATIDVEQVVKDAEELGDEERKGFFNKLAEAFGFKGHEEEDPPPKNDPDPENTPSGDDDKKEEKGDDDAKQATEEIATLKQQLAASEESRKANEERLVAIETASRKARFKDIILGRDEESVRQASEDAPLYPMVGELSEKMSVLEALADAKGEDSPEFKAYVAHEREHARQLRQAGTFSELGEASRDAAPKDTLDEFNRKVAAVRKEDDKLTEQEAIARVAREDPSLYARYDAETKRAPSR